MLQLVFSVPVIMFLETTIVRYKVFKAYNIFLMNNKDNLLQNKNNLLQNNKVKVIVIFT